MKSETRLLILRGFVAFCFIGAAALCGSLSYYLIHSIEYSNATKQYSNIALQALKLAELRTVSKKQGGQLLAKIYAWNVNATSWPNASIEGFQDISSTLIEMTTSLTLSMNPIVLPSEGKGFESFAYDFISTHPDEYTPLSGKSSFGKGQYLHLCPTIYEVLLMKRSIHYLQCSSNNLSQSIDMHTHL